MTTREIFTNGRAVLKGRWLTVLFLALAVSFPSLMVQTLGIGDNAAFNEQMTSLTLNWFDQLKAVLQNAGTMPTDPEILLTDMLEIVRANRMIMWWGLSVLAWLICPFLVLGMDHWMEEAHRGAELGFATVFSRISRFFSALFLRVLMAVKIFLWTLPGCGVCMLGYLLVFLTQSDSWIVLTLFELLFTAGTAAGVFFGVRAAISYSMSEFVMADTERKGPVESIRASKKLTRGAKGRVFGIAMLLILISLAANLVISLLNSLLGNVLGTVVNLLISLGIIGLQTSVQCALYLDLKGEKTVIPEPEKDERFEI